MQKWCGEQDAVVGQQISGVNNLQCISVMGWGQMSLVGQFAACQAWCHHLVMDVKEVLYLKC